MGKLPSSVITIVLAYGALAALAFHYTEGRGDVVVSILISVVTAVVCLGALIVQYLHYARTLGDYPRSDGVMFTDCRS